LLKPAPPPDPDPNAPQSPTDLVPLTSWIHPQLATLPVFVRGGAILPIAPLVQSTNEVPQGPLTLRVYAGSSCAGHLYEDDGKTYAYTNGRWLRMDFDCQVDPDRLQVKLGEHKGSYPAWWHEIRIEIYGWTPKKRVARVNGAAMGTGLDSFLNSSGGRLVLTLADDGRGAILDLE
jgi:alpha-glucosidase